MKNLIGTVLLILSINMYAQNSYKTEAGITFKIGDTLHLGEPKNTDSPSYITFEDTWSSLYTVQEKNSENMDFINMDVVISEIDISNKKTRFYFEAFSREYYVLIEDAIADNEVITKMDLETDAIAEKREVLDKYDKIKKLKELLDIDAITFIEFLEEKERLLIDEE